MVLSAGPRSSTPASPATGRGWLSRWRLPSGPARLQRWPFCALLRIGWACCCCRSRVGRAHGSRGA
eukprot:5838623-Pyramimonas_sp.AAC.1